MFNSIYTRVMAAVAMLGLSRAKAQTDFAGVPGPIKTPTVVRPRAQRQTPRKRRHSSGWLTRNGAQERARRMRQIKMGMLTGSNGLLFVGAANGDLPNIRTAQNSHGEVVRFY